MIRTQIQLTEKQARVLKEIAHEKGISMAELIRRQVDTLIDVKGVDSRDHLIDRAKEACGTYHSGKKDISERHNEYLAGDFTS